MMKCLLSLTVVGGLTLANGASASDFFRDAGPMEEFRSKQVPTCLRTPPVPDSAEPACVDPRLDATASDEQRLRRHLRRAEGFVLHRQLDRADQEITDALSIDPHSADAWHMAARLKLARGDRNAARVALDRALSLDSQNADIWATSASMRDENTDALREYQTALRLAPSHVFALERRLLINRSLGQHDASDRDLAVIARIQPTHQRAVDQRIENAIAAGDVAAAVAELDATVIREPLSLFSLIRRSLYLQSFGMHEEAVRDLDAILGTGAQSPRWAVDPAKIGRLHLMRAMSLKALGRHETAREEIVRAMTGAPRSLVLKVQVFLRGKGHHDVEVTGSLSPELEAAAVSCMMNPVCGRGMTSLT